MPIEQKTIVNPSCPDDTCSPLPSQFQHLCIAFRYQNSVHYNLCHLNYNYPDYSVQHGKSSEVIGQIQGLPPPLGEVVLKNYVSAVMTLELWNAGLKAMKKLSEEVGECYTLGALMLYVKRAIDGIPANSKNSKTWRHEVMLVTVINELEDRVFPERELQPPSNSCCLIM
jgi:hypothetical protein